MASEIRTERLFWAAMGDSDVSQTFGPFGSAEEAESHTVRLGWGWVAVWTRQVDEFNTVLDLKKRFYQPEIIRQDRKPSDVESIRRKLAPSHDIKPLNDDEAKFFAGYEQQLAEPTTFACAECGEDIAPDDLYEVPLEHLDGSKETIRFHADFARCCALKWSSKRLEEAHRKFMAILEMLNG